MEPAGGRKASASHGSMSPQHKIERRGHARLRRTFLRAADSSRSGIYTSKFGMLEIDAFTNAKMKTPSPLLVFSDDWGRHPSSSQHLIRHFLREREVVWVNTIGTRPPRLDLQTVRRVIEKIRHWSAKPTTTESESTSQGPTIVNPLMWPSFSTAANRQLNRWLLRRSLEPVLANLDQQPIGVTTLPLVADLIGSLSVSKWVYYCVDDFSVWPGYDGATMQKMEVRLVEKVDRIVAVSEPLVEHIRRLGKHADLLTHGVDTDHWIVKDQVAVPPELSDLEPPYVVFWGVVDRRMDLSFLSQLSKRLDRGTIVLIGPQEDPDPALTTFRNVVLKPPVPFRRLPEVAAAASVLIMPYADVAVTRAMQPLKLKEYLATGRPTVVRELPSTKVWSDACDVCSTPESFAEAVSIRIKSDLSSDQKRARLRLAAEGWKEKAQIFERWIDDACL